MRCKALKPTSDSRLQDFLGTLQSFEAYLRFQPALSFPLAASRQLRRALTAGTSAAQSFKVVPSTALVHSEAEIEAALNALGREPGAGVVLMPDVFVTIVHDHIGGGPKQRTGG